MRSRRHFLVRNHHTGRQIGLTTIGMLGANLFFDAVGRRFKDDPFVEHSIMGVRSDTENAGSTAADERALEFHVNSVATEVYDVVNGELTRTKWTRYVMCLVRVPHAADYSVLVMMSVH